MSDDTPDMDLINRVQQARMAHDADAIPSQGTGNYWIESKRKVDGPGPTSRAGHWLIVTTVNKVDALWERVKAATEDGLLGYKSKVTTASHTSRVSERTIHVVTYNADDGADVARVRNALRELGFTEKIPYIVD